MSHDADGLATEAADLEIRLEQFVGVTGHRGREVPWYRALANHQSLSSLDASIPPNWAARVFGTAVLGSVIAATVVNPAVKSIIGCALVVGIAVVLQIVHLNATAGLENEWTARRAQLERFEAALREAAADMAAGRAHNSPAHRDTVAAARRIAARLTGTWSGRPRLTDDLAASLVTSCDVLERHTPPTAHDQPDPAEQPNRLATTTEFWLPINGDNNRFEWVLFDAARRPVGRIVSTNKITSRRGFVDLTVRTMDGQPYLRIRPGQDEARVEDPVRHIATLRSTRTGRLSRSRDIVDRRDVVAVSERASTPMAFIGADGEVLAQSWAPYGRTTRKPLIPNATCLQLFVAADDPRRLMVLASWIAGSNGLPQPYSDSS